MKTNSAENNLHFSTTLRQLINPNFFTQVFHIQPINTIFPTPLHGTKT